MNILCFVVVLIINVDQVKLNWRNNHSGTGVEVSQYVRWYFHVQVLESLDHIIGALELLHHLECADGLLDIAVTDHVLQEFVLVTVPA